jgi:trk system potassium uptake protein TrkA
MYVVIVGCGRMGALAARMLANEGHDVAVIDHDRQTFDRLGSVFNGVTVEGGGFDEQVLLQAGIERADVFVAATDSDNANIMAAEIARKLFDVSHVVVRTYDPSKEYAYQRLGWNTICASVLGATKIRDEVLKTGVLSQMVLGGGEAEIIRFRPTRNVAGNTVGELEQVGDFRVCALIRGATGEEAILPGSGTIVQEHDILVAAVRLKALVELKERFGFA